MQGLQLSCRRMSKGYPHLRTDLSWVLSAAALAFRQWVQQAWPAAAPGPEPTVWRSMWPCPSCWRQHIHMFPCLVLWPLRRNRIHLRLNHFVHCYQKFTKKIGPRDLSWSGQRWNMQTILTASTLSADASKYAYGHTMATAMMGTS